MLAASTAMAPPPPLAPSIPVVRLDVDRISDVLAAGLASSLVGHVLFLKNQVPLPVMQLARMATRNKPRIPNSVEEATATATGDEKEKKATARMATREARAAKSQAELLASFDTLASHLSTTFTALSTAFARREGREGERDGEEGRKGACAYLAILVGPSVGTAKVKVVLGLDGLEVKMWGKREDGEGEEEEEEEGDEEEEDEEADEEQEEAGVEREEVDGAHEEADDDEEGPPPSPSPSPSPPASPPPAPYISHAQHQRVLLTSERLLSRTLALADAEGHGMASDIGPTQTHILIRAPRLFSHPAWIPMQNVTGMMEGVLNEFLGGGSGGRKRKVEGVWVVCSGGGGGEEEAVREEDEMIWWKWEGSLAGISDWRS